MTEMDSQRDLVRASLDRDNQKDVTPIRARLLEAAGNPPRVFESAEGEVTPLTRSEVAEAMAQLRGGAA